MNVTRLPARWPPPCAVCGEELDFFHPVWVELGDSRFQLRGLVAAEEPARAGCPLYHRGCISPDPGNVIAPHAPA